MVVCYCFREKNRGYEPSFTYFYVRQNGKGSDSGIYNFSGEKIVPLEYETAVLMPNPNGQISTSYTHSDLDLFKCKKYIGGTCTIYDGNGRCIIPDEYNYSDVLKVNIPTPIPLLCCCKKNKEYDYRYSTSGELFLSGLSGTISVEVIDKKKEMYYLAVYSDYEYYYYDIYGSIIFKGDKHKCGKLYYDEEDGFYYYDKDCDKDRYIYKKLDADGHIIPIRTYSSSFREWDNYGSSDVWVGSDLDGGYEWNDYSSPQNSSTTPQTGTHKCGLCGGSGWVINNDGISFGNTKYCDECGKTVPDSHYHTICPSCKGKGWW